MSIEEQARLSRGSVDVDPGETAEWLEALEDVVRVHGSERARLLLQRLGEQAARFGAPAVGALTTPYVNTLSRSAQPAYPGDLAIEKRLEAYARWNAMAMVQRANKKHDGLGGHIGTFASAATLYQVGFQHFFRGRGESGFSGDLIYFQGHASPGIYAQAFLEGRLSEEDLEGFRRELDPKGGVSSYPHPWLMPDFWEFPTVSMGLGPIAAIYQAKLNRYLENRGLLDTAGRRVWAFLGDGETDEPESLGALSIAARDGLDNLTFVINCNLQRLDGPVRGNGKIIQDLEGIFRGAGWNVIKVIWGGSWDPVFESDATGLISARLNQVVDGEFQKYSVETGAYVREHLFNTPELKRLAERYSDDELRALGRGGHDPEKVYAAYKAAAEHKGQPTVILAKTVKGYGLGNAGEGRNVIHQQKKLGPDDVRAFRDRFEIPISDADLADIPYYRPAEGSPEFEYLRERRAALGGPVPQRKVLATSFPQPKAETWQEFLAGDKRPVSTTMAFVGMLRKLLADKEIGPRVVPIVPDEARTFGMESLFPKYGIYSSVGQKYEPVDKGFQLYYKEARDGQILEEGITEAGSMASFIAAGTAYASHGLDLIPFYIFYSMFGFQRIGDLAWAAADQRTRGFLLGATAGRTTLNGEGLQHEDGHSHLLASTVPNVVAYDPAYAYEIAVILEDGLRRMLGEREDIYYYLTLQNENYPMPPMPEGAKEGILKGLYKLSEAPKLAGKKKDTRPRIHLLGSASILLQALRAQEILAERYGVAAEVWSATSYNELRREALACDRWNLLHPEEEPRVPYVSSLFAGDDAPVLAVSDYMKVVAEQVAPWLPRRFSALGTDGFGRSDTRESLRRFFEVDAETTTVAVLHQLARRGKVERKVVSQAITDLGIDPEKPDPARS